MANEPDWIDNKPLGTGGFGATADTSSITAPPPMQPQSWSDLGSDIYKSGKGAIEGQIGAGERFAAPYTSDPDAWRRSGTDWVNAGQQTSQSLSPAGQQITDAPFFSATTLEHPFSKGVMGAAKQGAWLAPALIPGGGVVSGIARAGIGAALGYTGAYSGVIDAINAQPDDQLQKNSPTYMQLRQTYPEYDAKQMLADQAWNNIGPGEKALILGTSALAGEAGGLATVGKTISGAGGATLSRLASGRIGQAAVGAAETGGVMGAQYAGTAIPTRTALTSVGAPADTTSDIIRGTIETTGMGAVIGGGAKFIRPQGGKNESRSDTRGADAQRGGTQVGEVPAGQPDPAQAAALKSAAQPVTGFETPYPHPTPTGYEQQYPIPPRPNIPVEPMANAAAPPTTDLAPRPPFRVPQPGDQRPLGINVPEQPPQPGPRGPQGELPLQPPRPPEPVQGELPLQQPSQGVTQPSLPGMGADVIHEPAAATTISPDKPLPPIVEKMGYGPDYRMRARPTIQKEEPEVKPEAKAEPEAKPTTEQPAAAAEEKPTGPQVAASKKAKAPVTKVSEEEPTAAPAAPAAKAAKPKTGPEIVAAAKPAAKAAAKAAAKPATKTGEAELPPETAKWLGKEEPAKAAAATTGTFDESKLGTGEAVLRGKAKIDALKAETEAAKAEAPAQMPFMITQLMKAQLRALGYKSEAISNMTPTDAHAILQGKTPPKPVQTERPTVAAKGEVPVTKVAATDARLKPIEPGEAAKKAAAEGVASVEKAKAKAAAKIAKATPETKTKIIRKSLGELKDAIDEKEAATEPISDEDAQQDTIPVRDITDVLQRAEALEEEPDKLTGAERLRDARASVEPNPTDAQEAAGNFKQGHPPADATHGQPVTIHSADSVKGEAEGHILGTADNIPGEHLDTIIHPDGVDGNIHVINAVDKDTGKFSHHVAVLGARNSDRALGIFQGVMKRKYGEDVADKESTLSTGVEHMSPEDFERWKQTRNPNEPVYPTASGKHPFEKIETLGKKVDTLGSNTLKGALEEALRKIPNDVRDPNYRLYTIYRKLAQQVIKYLPDVPVYYLDRITFDSLVSNANAFYNHSRNHILIAAGHTGKSSPEVTLLHEALHAATAHLYHNNRIFRAKVDALLKEYKAGVGSLGKEGETISTNVMKGGAEELLAELASPRVQSQLARIQMSKGLASKLNMSGWAEATQTLWNGFVHAFKDALQQMGFEIPGRNDASKFTLLEGLLKLNDDAFINRSAIAHTDFAKMIKAVKSNADKGSKSLIEQHNSELNIYDTVHNAVSRPETLQAHYDSGAKRISDTASDIVDKLPRGILKQKAYEWVVPFEGTDALRMDTEGFFGPKNEANPMRRWNETGLRRDKDFSDRSKKVNDNISDMFDEYRGHTKAEIEHFADTLSHATAYRFDPRYKVGEGTNEWMSKPGWQWRNEAKQALANADRITRMYNAIAPDLRPRFTKIVDEYRQAGREHAEKAVGELIDSISNAGQKFLEPLKVIDPKEVKLRDRQEYIKFHNNWETNWEKNKEILRDHLLNNDLTEDEERWLAERGFKDISDIRDLASPRGPFVPLDHAGEFIINARTKIEPPANGTLVNGTDNVYRFKTEAEAEAFLNKQPPKSNMSTVYFNDKGEQVPKWEKWQNPDGSIGLAKNNKAWHVEVNDKYYSGHDSISAANRRYQQLKESGAFSKIAPPQSKRSGWYSGLEISSPLFKHLISEVEKRKDYTDAQKKAVIQLLKDSALSSMEGNRIAKHLLPRKAVAGWETDYIKTYKSYFDAHNALMSRSKYAKDINAATNEMIKHADNNQFEKEATERSYILTELNKRDNFFGTPNHLGDEGGNKLIGRVMKYAEAASFFANMVSPGHLITHQTHQILTYDMLAAKYGPAKTMARASKMHGILAGTGFRNVLRSVGAIRDILTKDSKGLNYVESLMDKVTQDPKYGAELKAMLEEAIATNRIHPDQGFDASVLHMGSGRLERGLARLDLASRQMMGSTEAYSRVWGYSLGYTLARDAGETPQQAMRTAFDSVSRTQGMLSRSNMSSAMNKWYMRAPMQFRAWGINMMMTLAKSVHDIFKPDAPGVRAEAVRRLLYLFGSTAALTGINGLPSDPMRVGLALVGALGLTNYNWSDAQDKMREFFAEETSPGIANFLMDGLLASLGPFSFFGADRVGFGSLAVFGEPDDYTKGSLIKWGMQIAGGAPFEQLWNIRDGIDGVNEGNYAKAIKAFIPLKIVADWAKAWQGAYEGFPTKTGAPGMEPYSAGETFMQSMGLTPARKERWREATEAEYRAEKFSRDEKTQLLNGLGTATNQSDRIKAQMQISAFNLRNPQSRITPQDTVRAMRRQTAPSGLGKTLTRSNTARVRSLEEYYEAY